LRRSDTIPARGSQTDRRTDRQTVMPTYNSASQLATLTRCLNVSLRPENELDVYHNRKLVDIVWLILLMDSTHLPSVVLRREKRRGTHLCWPRYTGKCKGVTYSWCIISEAITNHRILPAIHTFIR